MTTLRSQLLGKKLRALRDERSLTIEQVAQALHISVAKLSRIELGHVRIDWPTMKALLDEYAIAADSSEREALHEWAKKAQQRGWWTAYTEAFGGPFLDLISAEETASRIDTYEIQLVPGLLQTREYALATVESSRAWETREDVERFVEVRMNRQAVLRRANPLQMWVILGEAALRQQVGGAKVMRAQLSHLADLVEELPNLTIQVLPFNVGETVGLGGAFVNLEFELNLGGQEVTRVVYVETAPTGFWLDDPQHVTHYVNVYKHLGAAALSPEKSKKLLKQIAKEPT